jgi:hypothetical protein
MATSISMVADRIASLLAARVTRGWHPSRTADLHHLSVGGGVSDNAPLDAFLDTHISGEVARVRRLGTPLGISLRTSG